MYGQCDRGSLNDSGVKNVNYLLWSIPSVNPRDLVWLDMLHNILLMILDSIMNAIQCFFEQYNCINCFGYV